MGSPRRWSVLLALVVWGSFDAAGAEPPGQHGVWQEAKPTTDTVQNGVSGIAWVGSDEKGESQFLLVHDAKGNKKDFVRLSLATVAADGTASVARLDFPGGADRTNDGEEVAAIPGMPGHFLVVAKAHDASGATLPGHLLHHVVLDKTKVSVTAVGPLSVFDEKDDDVEGLALRQKGETLVMLVAHRGGGKPPARIACGTLTFAADGKPAFAAAGAAQDVHVSFWDDCTDLRSISGLFVDAESTVWATASCETPKVPCASPSSKMDAMRGALYVLGSVQVGADGTPALALKEPFVARGFHCHKVEGLVPMPKSGGAFLLAADDDEGGGFLRVP